MKYSICSSIVTLAMRLSPSVATVAYYNQFVKTITSAFGPPAFIYGQPTKKEHGKHYRKNATRRSVELQHDDSFLCWPLLNYCKFLSRLNDTKISWLSSLIILMASY